MLLVLYLGGQRASLNAYSKGGLSVMCSRDVYVYRRATWLFYLLPGRDEAIKVLRVVYEFVLRPGDLESDKWSLGENTSPTRSRSV
jgi:hypothetical protein